MVLGACYLSKLIEIISAKVGNTDSQTVFNERVSMVTERFGWSQCSGSLDKKYYSPVTMLIHERMMKRVFALLKSLYEVCFNLGYWLQKAHWATNFQTLNLRVIFQTFLFHPLRSVIQFVRLKYCLLVLF